MNAVLGRIVDHGVGPALFLGRLLLAWIFLHEGFVLATDLNGALAAMAKLGVSAPLVIATIALQLAAGAALAIGWQSRIAALGLGLFCVATAVAFHTNFASRNELLHFEKDLAIAGGLFVLAICGAGPWSLDSILVRGGRRGDVQGGLQRRPHPVGCHSAISVQLSRYFGGRDRCAARDGDESV